MGSTDEIESRSETSMMMCRVLDLEFPSWQSCPREELQLDCGFCYSYSLSLSRSTSGSLRDVAYLGLPVAPLYMSLKAGGGGVSANPISTAVHMEPK